MKIQYCSLPNDNDLRLKWVDQIRRHQAFDVATSTYSICELHFKQTDVFVSGKRKLLIKGAVPTIFPL